MSLRGIERLHPAALAALPPLPPVSQSGPKPRPAPVGGEARRESDALDEALEDMIMRMRPPWLRWWLLVVVVLLALGGLCVIALVSP